MLSCRSNLSVKHQSKLTLHSLVNYVWQWWFNQIMVYRKGNSSSHLIILTFVLWYKYMFWIFKYHSCVFCRVQFRYGASWASRHPYIRKNPGNFTTEIILEAGEKLAGIEYKSGGLIEVLEFVTNFKTYPRLGRSTNTRRSISGYEIKFFLGNSHWEGWRGRHVTRLRAVFQQC